MWLRIGIVLVLIVAIGATANYLRPIPATAATGSLPASESIPGTPPAIPWPAHGSAALAVAHLGMIGSSGNEQPIPAASTTKVMTALVLLEDKPLKKGDSGPTISLTDVDVQYYRTDVAGDQSTVPVEAGETLTELQALEGALIPSANNLAETLARWDAGSIEAFVTKMNKRAADLQMTHTRFADVSGASPGSVSTPSDLVKLGTYAMEHQDVIAQVVAMGQADLPVAGTVYNVDSVLGKSGIFGIKTGSGLNTGANFMFAANATVDGSQVVVYGCVMGEPTLQQAFTDTQTLIGAVTSALHVRKVITQNQTLATYTTAWGEQTDLVASVDVSLVEWPGMVLRQRLRANSLTVDHPIAPRTQEGSVHLVLGDYDLDVPLVTADPLYPPGRFWRLTRISL
ncbi:MAG TPA: D-alanyl-D-alanine carboxypeptidase [Candidatus Dormibacteraeota bacterium]|nr:D-alanyl-D-alanine carboxypeptidase [Candidatus Dormibacteraeota bacterium]